MRTRPAAVRTLTSIVPAPCSSAFATRLPTACASRTRSPRTRTPGATVPIRSSQPKTGAIASQVAAW